MILTKDKALNLLQALDKYCKKHKISMPKNKSLRYIQLAKIIFNRYKSVALIQGNTKIACNNPKYLKKWAMEESLKNVKPLYYYYG